MADKSACCEAEINVCGHCANTLKATVNLCSKCKQPCSRSKVVQVEQV